MEVTCGSCELWRLKREKLHEERDSLLKSQSKVLNPSKINDLHVCCT